MLLFQCLSSTWEVNRCKVRGECRSLGEHLHGHSTRNCGLHDNRRDRLTLTLVEHHVTGKCSCTPAFRLHHWKVWIWDEQDGRQTNAGLRRSTSFSLHVRVCVGRALHRTDHVVRAPDALRQRFRRFRFLAAFRGRQARNCGCVFGDVSGDQRRRNDERLRGIG